MYTPLTFRTGTSPHSLLLYPRHPFWGGSHHSAEGKVCVFWTSPTTRRMSLNSASDSVSDSYFWFCHSTAAYNLPRMLCVFNSFLLSLTLVISFKFLWSQNGTQDQFNMDLNPPRDVCKYYFGFVSFPFQMRLGYQAINSILTSFRWRSRCCVVGKPWK